MLFLATIRHRPPEKLEERDPQWHCFRGKRDHVCQLRREPPAEPRKHRKISGPARSRADTRDTASDRSLSFYRQPHLVLLPGPFPTLEEDLQPPVPVSPGD